jgi:hypothetical protein
MLYDKNSESDFFFLHQNQNIIDMIEKQRKKKLRTAIEWDYGILPPPSIKGLPTDKNVRSIDLPK